MNTKYRKQTITTTKKGDLISHAPQCIIPSLTVGKIKMATNPVNMGSVAVFYFVTICAIL